MIGKVSILYSSLDRKIYRCTVLMEFLGATTAKDTEVPDKVITFVMFLQLMQRKGKSVFGM